MGQEDQIVELRIHIAQLEGEKKVLQAKLQEAERVRSSIETQVERNSEMLHRVADNALREIDQLNRRVASLEEQKQPKKRSGRLVSWWPL